MGRLLWVRRALASALTCLILALVILIPLFSLLTIIASQALEFSSTVSQGLQTGHLWQWVAAKLDAVKGYLHHLNLPLPPEQIKLESIVQTVLTRASAAEIQTLAQERLAAEAVVRTDGWQGYSVLDRPPRRHEWVVPGSGPEAAPLGAYPDCQCERQYPRHFIMG